MPAPTKMQRTMCGNGHYLAILVPSPNFLIFIFFSFQMSSSVTLYLEQSLALFLRFKWNMDCTFFASSIRLLPTNTFVSRFFHRVFTL